MDAETWIARDEPGELVGGEVVDEEMGSEQHEAAVVWLILLLGAWARERGARVFGQDWHVKIDESKGRKPDVSVYMTRRRPYGRPDLAVEVVSPSKADRERDLEEKVVEYAALGIPHYLVVDPHQPLAVAYELTADGVYRPLWVAVRGRHPVPGCEGLELDLDALWADAEA